MIKRKIGIITINLKDEAYLDPGYRYQIPVRYEDYKLIDLRSFILRDLFEMLSEFNTIGDFVTYLDERKYLFPKLFQEYTNDLDIVAIFKAKYVFIEEIKSKSYDKVVIPTGFWEEYCVTMKDRIIERDNKIKRSTIIDLIIDVFNSNLDYVIVQKPNDKEKAII